MENLMELLKSDIFVLIMPSAILVLLIGFIIMITKLTNLNKKYKKILQKMGNGKDITEDLENYMYRVERVEKQNAEITNYIKNLEEDLSKCIQKVGIVRYNAFKDTGSDLSFTLALLDEKNDGVVLNGIYSREMSNIYAKPVKNGDSTYTISDEERQAINKAIESENTIRIK